MDKKANLDKFFEMAFTNYTTDNQSEEMKDKIDELFKPILDKLESLLAHDIVIELEESLVDCYVTCTNIAGVEGMKLAIGVINGDIRLSL